jgi:hypothetical protein
MNDDKIKCLRREDEDDKGDELMRDNNSPLL